MGTIILRPRNPSYAIQIFLNRSTLAREIPTLARDGSHCRQHAVEGRIRGTSEANARTPTGGPPDNDCRATNGRVSLFLGA